MGDLVFSRPNFPVAIVLSEKARQLLAGWPSDSGDALYTRFLSALDESIAAASNDEERGKLERLRADASEIGKGVLVSVLSNLARIHGVPL